jgi:hypothetical protein
LIGGAAAAFFKHVHVFRARGFNATSDQFGLGQVGLVVRIRLVDLGAVNLLVVRALQMRLSGKLIPIAVKKKKKNEICEKFEIRLQAI